VKLVAIVVLLAIPATATASFPGKNGRIAVSSDWGCPGAYIQSVRPDGSGVRPLGPEPCDDDGRPDQNGTWTADGRTLLFNGRIARDDSKLTVLSMGARGGRRRPLPVPEGVAPQPSRSGEQLVYERHPAGGTTRPEIWRVKTDGSDPVRLGVGSKPRYSPNGRRIAFIGPHVKQDGSGSPAERGLWLMDLDGEVIRRITDVEVNSFDWSPNGRRLAYATQPQHTGDRNDLYTIDVTGKRRRRVTKTARRRELSPAWSPNGRWLAFVRVISRPEEQAPIVQVRKERVRSKRPSRLVIKLPFAFEAINGPAYPTTLSWQAVSR
jgi:Tol biopolymer transport system component